MAFLGVLVNGTARKTHLFSFVRVLACVGVACLLEAGDMEGRGERVSGQIERDIVYMYSNNFMKVLIPSKCSGCSCSMV